MKSKGFSLGLALTLVIAIISTACVSNTINKVEKEDVNKLVEEDIIKGDTEVIATKGLINIDVPFEPREFEAKVMPYEVNESLSNIENLELFSHLSKEQKELLIKNNFVVSPSKEEQLFYIYEDNEYKKIPSFITTDSILQVYHVFYDFTLRTLETEKLLGLVEEMTESMLVNSIELYNELDNQEVKEIQLKNIAYFSVAQLALEKELPSTVPEKAKEIALGEMEKIKNHIGIDESILWPHYDLDYSQYTIRGHYTRSDDLARYFRAMMWYGQGPFPLYMEEDNRNIEQTIQALLITYSLYSDEKTYRNWENIYEPTNFFVGSSDDLSIYQYGDLLIKVYGREPDLNKLMDREKLDELYKEADKLPEPRIKGKYTTVRIPVGKQFRLMGQRYLIDGDIIQELVEPIVRPIPSGLDVMGVLGSKRAEEIQMSKEENQYWEEYPKVFEKLKGKFKNIPDTQWRGNMYQGWLWTLLGLLEPFGEGYPSFMTNQAWVDKDLNTALGSWSELKHDTVLYGKQSGAEMGGEGYEEIIGYVEPNIEVYEKLLWLTKFSKKNLIARGLSLGTLEDKMERFEDLLEFLINCSIKELRNEDLDSSEYERIQYYGGILEGLTASFAGEDYLRWFEITSETDKNMAIIADFHTIAPNQFSPGGYMEAGVGPAYEIYVVVPIGGKLYLTRGAVFSYHEFLSDERLTDEKWQEMIERDLQPPMPEWTKSFIR